jgi:hypothetical protein
MKLIRFFLYLQVYLQSCHALSSCLPPIIDPPSIIRNGDDFDAIPISESQIDPFNYCISLCCNSSIFTCVAFSYNYPQPERSGNCTIGSRCCMLKNGNGTIIPNPWPKNVTTGYMTGFTPGPTPPFLPSLFLSNVVFGTPRSWNTSAGDTWPSAWASNGELYAWPCDSKDGPMSLKRIDGNPSDDIGLSAVSISNGTPLNYTQLCSSLGKTGSYPYINIKPAGMVALPPSTTSPLGTLIVGVSCMNYGDDVVFNRQHNLAGFIAESYDGGVTWTNTTIVGRLFIGRFSAPVFISCGQANIPCQEKDGDILYVFFPGSINNQAYWDNNDAMFLAQVPTDSRSDMTKYSFFAGLNNDGNPLWTFDSLEAQPSVYFGNMIGENPVSYHPFLKRYLIANFGFIDNVGNPRPWHTEPFMSPHRTQLIILESKNPWGPWFLFYRSDDSGSFTPPAPGLYVPSFPSKFMTDISDGKIEFWMIFACLDGSPSCLYTLNWINLTVTVNTTLL